jgi:hypothetical protein
LLLVEVGDVRYGEGAEEEEEREVGGYHTCYI